MKHLGITTTVLVLLLGLSTCPLKAQQIDSTLVGISIFDLIRTPGPQSNHITIQQTSAIEQLVLSTTEENRAKQTKMSGYRIRIFFDNKQSSRSESQRIAQQFSEDMPLIGVYWAYDTPYFKVTVGDFRTKSDAQRFLNTIIETYPQAFITREMIQFPQMD